VLYTNLFSVEPLLNFKLLLSAEHIPQQEETAEEKQREEGIFMNHFL